MKVKEFKARVETLEYKEFETKSKFAKNDKAYCAQCTILESHQGSPKYKIKHNITLYMTEQEYSEKIIGVGDIIVIGEDVTFTPSLVSFNTYDEEKLKKLPSNKIRTDDKGRPYAPSKAFAYTLSAKIGKWKVDRKAEEMFYWQLGRLKIFMEDEKEMLNEASYAFYLEDQEYEKIQDLVGQENIVINAYKYKNKVSSQKISLQVEKNEKINKWKCIITKLDFESPTIEEF